jgi:hypothetical protein
MQGAVAAMRTRHAVLLFLQLLLPGAGAAADGPQIALAPVGDVWRVTYTLVQPAAALRFTREDRAGNRARTWRAVDDGFELVQVDGVETMRRVDGAAFITARFDVPPLYMPLDKDYAPFSPFGDGGLLIHTGRFHACAGACAEVPGWRFTVEPPAGRHVIHEGRVSAEAVTFEDHDSGTKLYVGAAEPVETEHVVAVIDEAFLPLARRQLESLLPRLMAFYAHALGALPSRPMLFASHDAAHPGGDYGFQGGTLPGQVFVHLYGRHDNLDHDDFAARMNWFFAHEAAHLYQHYALASDPGQAWIHEGGAEALAAIALLRFGLLDTHGLRTRVQPALQQCAAGIGDHPLNESAANGTFANYYSCGLLMHLAVDAAARRRSDGDCDLLCVWRAFQDRVSAGEPWNQQVFLDVVATHAGRDVAAFLREAADTAQADAAAFLQAGLRKAGLGEVP